MNALVCDERGMRTYFSTSGSPPERAGERTTRPSSRTARHLVLCTLRERNQTSWAPSHAKPWHGIHTPTTETLQRVPPPGRAGGLDASFRAHVKAFLARSAGCFASHKAGEGYGGAGDDSHKTLGKIVAWLGNGCFSYPAGCGDGVMPGSSARRFLFELLRNPPCSDAAILTNGAPPSPVKAEPPRLSRVLEWKRF